MRKGDLFFAGKMEVNTAFTDADLAARSSIVIFL